MQIIAAQVELLARFWDAVDSTRVDTEVAKMVVGDSSRRNGRCVWAYACFPHPFAYPSCEAVCVPPIHSHLNPSHTNPSHAFPSVVAVTVLHSMLDVQRQRQLIPRVPRDIKYDLLRSNLRERRFRHVRRMRKYRAKVKAIQEEASKRELALKVTSILRSNHDQEPEVRDVGVCCASDAVYHRPARRCMYMRVCGRGGGVWRL